MGIDRRTFIQLVTGGVVGSLFTPVIWKSLDDAAIWSQNWPWIPRLKYGQITEQATLSKFGPSPCSLTVKSVGGSPYVVKGNVENEMSKGGVDAISAGGAQLLYSPSRVNGPMKKVADGKYESISWEEAEKMLSEKLSAVKGQAGKLAIVSGDATGTSSEVLSAFAAGMGSSDCYLMPGDEQAAAVALDNMGGSGQIGYDLDNSDFVLFIGADAMNSWGSVVRNQRVYSEMRPTGEDLKSVYVYAGPFLNSTASSSDKWIPVAPGTGAIFSLGLAYHMLNSGSSASASDFADFKTLVMSRFTPDKVEKAIGVAPGVMAGLAKQLMSASAPLVISGSEFGQGAGAVDIIAATALNMLLGRVGEKGGMKLLADLPLAVDSAVSRTELSSRDFAGYLAAVASDKVKAPEVLLAYEANPVYAMPQADTMAAAIAKVPFLVSFSTWMDETASKADLIMPNPHSFERFDDAQTPYGVGVAMLSACAPVTEPIYNGKSTIDVVLGVASGLGIDLGYESAEAVLQAKAEKAGADWDSLVGGAAFVSDSTESGSLKFAASVLSKAVAMPKGGEIALAPYAKLNVGSSTVAIPPLNCVTISKFELQGKDLFVQINGVTAKKLNVSEGSKVKLTGTGGECVARVHINEGVMNDVIAAPLGFGHTAWDVFSRGKGDNISKILTVGTEPGTGMAVWTSSFVSIA
ncbi:menaquinone reductase molybdopterin-binding-like subunit QrcB [Maridesulfovibrio ferrireducens]|uniref:menaquinone reductase molybdopterin-binding-like subunit QrcB n=1 Tax=Maridesulfovibrio ferrireducens TaxID=246191 RepID=UPI001A20A7C3|nr:menaquinone reductase molybdopterin-binding-like subunit QrcB [Maridesulfovibrio ferrireducens]MBI9112504.1 molybdopterin-dependent oxidoreductase [Maridesulfovibrio ferrireducens]